MPNAELRIACESIGTRSEPATREGKGGEVRPIFTSTSYSLFHTSARGGQIIRLFTYTPFRLLSRESWLHTIPTSARQR